MGSQARQRNQQRLKQTQNDIPYTERTWALTGRLLPDGITVDSDTIADLQPRYMWVRVQGSRNNARALIGPGMFDHYRRPNKQISIGRNRTGQLVAIEPWTDDLTAFTEGMSGVGVEARDVPLPVNMLMGLRLLPPRDAHTSGLWVFLEAYPPLGWLGGDVEVTSGEPANTGEFGWTSLYLDDDGRPGIYVHTAEVKADMMQLLFQPDLLIAELPDNVYPIGAVSLFNGQTELTRTNTRYEDYRLLFNKKQADISQVVIDGRGFPVSDGRGLLVLNGH